MLRAAAAAALVATALAQPRLSTSDGNIIAAPSDGKDFMVVHGNDASSWSDLLNSDTEQASTLVEQGSTLVAHGEAVQSLVQRSDNIEATLGIGRRQAENEGDAASLTDLMRDLINIQISATASLGNLVNVTRASATSGAMILGTTPAEVGSTGGDTVHIAGYNFLAGVPGIYKCAWRYTAPNGQVTFVESEPTTAATANSIPCVAPAWPHPPAQAEYSAQLVVTQLGEPVPATGAIATAFANEVPTMTDLTSTGVELTVRDVTNNQLSFTILVADPDGNPDHVTVTGSADNASFVRGVSVSNRGYNRTVTVSVRGECGRSNITLIASDRLTGNSSQTFLLDVACSLGWIPIVRSPNSRSNSQYFQRGMSALQYVEDTGSNYGAFTTMNTVQGATGIKITQLSGRQAGQFAVFRFVAPLAGTMRSTIMGCGQTGSYSNSPSTTAWTSRWSGTKIEGGLQLYNRYNQRQQLRYMFICGVNLSSDDDHSVLAFTYYPGHSNDWGDSWRGSYQRGTIWSLYNDDYRNYRGWGSIQSYPGYKAGSYNAGAYEISITQDAL